MSNQDNNMNDNRAVSHINFSIQYPYELNEVLNSQMSEQEKVSNYTSLLTDKDRFEQMIDKISSLKEFFQTIVGLEFPENQGLFVIRAELFNSVPTPLIIEYQLQPEKMILCTLKEIIKNVLGGEGIRCIDEVQQEELLLSTLEVFSQKIEENTSIKLAPFISWMLANSQTYLKSKHFELDEKRVEEYIQVMQQNSKTLISIIEESYNSLY
ncbi:MAG: hypothetical protein ACMXYB_04945 [Candidatus Woesearchaeota archaeon]